MTKQLATRLYVRRAFRAVTTVCLLTLTAQIAAAADQHEFDSEFNSFKPVPAAVTSAVAPAPITMIELGIHGPLVGIEALEVHGDTIIDSYRSTEGPYNPALAGDQGGLVSGGPVTITGHAVVCGDVLAGHYSGVIRSGGVVVTGDVGRRSTVLELGPVDAGSIAAANDNNKIPNLPRGDRQLSPLDANRNLRLRTGQTLDLTPGTYYFHNVTIDQHATLNVTGPTTLYVTGNFRSTDAALNNTSRLPTNLRVLSSGERVEISGRQAFFGLIYAPGADVAIRGDFEYHGAVIGKTVTVTGARAVHFDETLEVPVFPTARRTVRLETDAAPTSVSQR